MNLPNLLITGSSGVIGTVLKKGLADSFKIYGVDLKAVPSERTFKADVSDYDRFVSILKHLVPLPYVVHLAGITFSKSDWTSVLRNNIIGTRNVYEAAKELKVKRVLFASSSHATGAYEGFPPSLHKRSTPQPIAVHDPVRPDSDYGTSKVFGEAIARQYYELYGIESICLRIGTVLADDDPASNERFRNTWLSHRDLLQLVRKSLLSDVTFGIYYGVSANKNRFWDISNVEREIGYHPEDDADER